MVIKLCSRQTEKTSGGITTVIAWNGTFDEMTELFNSEAAGAINTTNGELDSIRLFQESPYIWCCEKKYSTDTNGNSTSDKPHTVYGKKSATLKGSMLSLPLESHPKYRTCWNHFLAVAPGASTSPSWWKSATDTLLSSSDAQKYAWIKTAGEVPVDAKGRWSIVQPLKAGVETYDVAVYSVTETAKYSTSNSAGKAVAGKLNKIGSPETSFGISGGSWKCDDASVFYDGKDWFSTVTWTLSGDSSGWDKDLYS